MFEIFKCLQKYPQAFVLPPFSETLRRDFSPRGVKQEALAPTDLHTSSALSALQRTVLYKHAASFSQHDQKTDTNLLQYLQHVATASRRRRKKEKKEKEEKKKLHDIYER